MSTHPHGACAHANDPIGSGGPPVGASCGVSWDGMRIVGLGLDATEVPRIAAMLDAYGDRFRHRVYTAGEIAYCDAKEKRGAAASYAARLAAKSGNEGNRHQSAGVLWRDTKWSAVEAVPRNWSSMARHDAISTGSARPRP